MRVVTEHKNVLHCQLLLGCVVGVFQLLPSIRLRFVVRTWAFPTLLDTHYHGSIGLL